MTVNKKSVRVIGVFTLAMINVAAIASLRGLPSLAEYGLSSAFYYILAALVFLIPVSLVSAELATGWPKRGGVFIWVKEALGQRWGFLAIWLQWIQNVIWYPTILSFTAATFAFIISPKLASNPVYMVAVILIVYWGSTLINLRGMKLSGRISSIGVIAGTLIPGAIIIALGLTWIFSGAQSQISFSWGELIPDLSNIRNLALVVMVLLGFAGMEMSAVHAQEVKDPQKEYPKAIFLSVGVILTVLILATLAVAIVVPQGEISLVAGVMQAFTDFFDAYNVPWLIPILAFMITIGAIGQVVTWIAGPSKGLFATARHGELPPFFQKVNKNGVARNLLLAQGGIVTLLSLVFLLMPSVSSSYWILTALTAQLYLIMYILMFISAIVLKYTKPNVKRAFMVPGGKIGMWVNAGIGFIAAIFGITLGFLPPSQLDTGNILFFETFLVIGIIVMAGAPLLIHHFRKPKWISKKTKD